MEYVLNYILQCAAKRKEILDAGIDTADATKLPTEELKTGEDFIEEETLLRITEIEAVLANEEYENEVEECCLEIELQFLQGNKNAYDEPYAFIGTDNVSFDVIYEEENDRYSATMYDKDGNPQIPYLNDKDVHKLVKQILKNGGKDDGRD